MKVTERSPVKEREEVSTRLEIKKLLHMDIVTVLIVTINLGFVAGSHGFTQDAF